LPFFVLTNLYVSEIMAKFALMSENKILTVKEWMDEWEESPNINEFLIKLGQARLGYRRKLVILKKLLIAHKMIKE